MLTKSFDKMENKVWLSSPTMHGEEIKYIQEAYDTNWMSTVGANLNEVDPGKGRCHRLLRHERPA